MEYPFAATLPYKITQVTTAFNVIVSRWLDKHGISIPIYRALVVLRDGEVRSLKELAQIISVEQSTLSRQLTAMARRGLITRYRPEDNGRIVRIEITDEGRALVEDLNPFLDGLEKVMLEGISPQVADDLKDALAQIERNLRASRDGEPKPGGA
jgi:DNA-binding MarR family transcriptional regulator